MIRLNKSRILGFLFLIAFIAILCIMFSSSYYPIIFILTSIIFIGSGFIFLDIFQKHTKFEDPIPERYPSITILIPAHNEEEGIAGTIGAVKKMEYPTPIEIIVLDDGSTDKTYEIAKRFKGIKIFRAEKNMGKAAVLNKGISLAKGEIVGNVDADTYPNKDVLMKMIGYFNDEKVGASTALVIVDKPKTFLEKLQQLEYYVAFGFWHKSLSTIDGLYVTPGPMSLYRKSALLKIGGYDEKNITEDMEIALNLKQHGYKIGCCINSKVSTSVPSTFKGYFKQRLRWYRGAIYNSFKHKKLFFNKNNKHFGYFVFPLFLLTIFVGASLVFGTIFLNFKYFFNFIYIYSMEIIKGGFNLGSFFNFDILNFPAYYINFLIIAFIWGFFLYQGLKLDKTRDIKAKPIHFAFYLVFYSLLLSFMYFVSIFYEFLEINKKW